MIAEVERQEAAGPAETNLAPGAYSTAVITQEVASGRT